MRRLDPAALFDKVFGRIPDPTFIREIANVFRLNYAQKRFVQDAIPGSDEKEYSQAFLGVDGEWRGIGLE